MGHILREIVLFVLHAYLLIYCSTQVLSKLVLKYTSMFLDTLNFPLSSQPWLPQHGGLWNSMSNKVSTFLYPMTLWHLMATTTTTTTTTKQSTQNGLKLALFQLPKGDPFDFNVIIQYCGSKFNNNNNNNNNN